MAPEAYCLIFIVFCCQFAVVKDSKIGNKSNGRNESHSLALKSSGKDTIVEEMVSMKRAPTVVRELQSRNPNLASYLRRVARDASTLDPNEDAKCYEACVGEAESDQCESEDNWLVADENNWDYEVGFRVLFAIFYILVLLYLFVGVSIVSDIFMASIEVLTSQVCNFELHVCSRNTLEESRKG